MMTYESVMREADFLRERIVAVTPGDKMQPAIELYNLLKRVAKEKLTHESGGKAR